MLSAKNLPDEQKRITMCRKSKSSNIINNNDRTQKHLVYGQVKGFFYCDCDRDATNKVNKKAERRRTKQAIKQELLELSNV